MFRRFFMALRDAGVPVSLREYLTLLEALDADLAARSAENFHHLARALLVKDERLYDRFDQVFAHVFAGAESLSDALMGADLPEDWLRAAFERVLSEEEKAEIEAMGGLDALMEALRERLDEQDKRHEGGSRMIGTGGTSPFGAYGYNPEGVRMGQAEGRHGRAVKVWDKREFADLAADRHLESRDMQMALRGLRRLARDGAPEELDLDATITQTAREGWLDLAFRPERRNAAKILLFLDVGGSMDPFIAECERLFTAARAEFKRLDVYYFHNCLYERVWTDNRRRFSETTETWDVLHRIPSDAKTIFVGDASMSPYEILAPGGAVEHANPEAGAVWLKRVVDLYPHLTWLNPVPESEWGWTPSIGLVREIIGEDRMLPLTLEGVEAAARMLR